LNTLSNNFELIHEETINIRFIGEISLKSEIQIKIWQFNDLKILDCQKWGEKSKKLQDFYIWFLMSSQIYKNMIGILFFIYGL
jgi:hypothetical protein